jgi:hypothetical protein
VAGIALSILWLSDISGLMDLMEDKCRLPGSLSRAFTPRPAQGPHLLHSCHHPACAWEGRKLKPGGWETALALLSLGHPARKECDSPLQCIRLPNLLKTPEQQGKPPGELSRGR